MPSAKKDGKKKKKSKKELEQERLLLEEQKRKEEEAQRFAELTKQREKELIELKEREERDEYLEKQSEVHEQERFQLQDMSRIAEEEVHRLTKEIESKEEWEQYCACSPLPFIQSEPEVAAFLTVFQTIHEKQSFDQLRHALVEMEPLVQGLEKEYGKSMDQGQFILAQRYAKNLLTLYSMVQRKIDAMTAYILQNPEQFPREPSENLLLVQELHTHCHYCLWVNYTKNPRHKSFDIRDVHIALPKTLTLSNVAIRVVVDRSDLAMTTTYLREGVAAASSSSSSSPSPTSTPIPTLSRQTVVSGVIVLSLLDVPDPPKTIDFWTLRPLLSNQLITRPVEYPFQKKMVDRHHHPNDLEDPRQRPESKEPSEVHEDDAIHVSFTLGAGLFIHPLATVKWWNEEVQQWESQGISEVEIDRSKGMVHFKTTMFKPCALVQSSYSDFPFEDWKLKPTVVENSNEVVARYLVSGKWTDAEFEVSKEGVKLIRPMTESLMAYFNNQYFQPTFFFMKLLKYGLSFASPYALNETPEEKECYTSIPYKLPPLMFQYNKTQTHLEDPCTLLVLKDDMSMLTAVLDFHRIIVSKPRRLIYIANEEDFSRLHPDFKPHGTLLALLNELVPFTQPDWRFILHLTMVLRITCPLNKK